LFYEGLIVFFYNSVDMSNEKNPSCPPLEPQGPPFPPSYSEAVGTGPCPPGQPGGYAPGQPGGYPPGQPGGYPPSQPGGYPPGQAYPPNPAVYPNPVPIGFAQVQGPPPAGFPPQTQTVYHTQGPRAQATTIVTTVVPVGPSSTHLTCPHCHAIIDTTVASTPSIWAWISGLLIFALGCWAGCCLIPCCMDSCMNKEHTCPSCKSYIGSYQRDAPYRRRY